MSQNTIFHDNKGFNQIFLPKGDHVFRVDHRNDCNFAKIEMQDTNVVMVRVDYLEV